MNVFKTLSGDQVKPLTPNRFQNVFGFYSPTGGTGVTTFIANLAVVLASQKKVALLDLDLYYPSLFRFFMKEDSEETTLRYDILEKFLAEGNDVSNFGHETSVPNVTLFSAAPEADITRLCNISISGVKTCIQELSASYDYVLIDIKGNLNQESVTTAIENSTRVYSFIRPCVSDIERICKDTDILKTYSFGAKTQNIILSPVKTPFDGNSLEEYGLKFVLSIPYIKQVEDVGYNYDLFVNVNGGASKSSQAYIQCCQYLAERIVNYELERGLNKDVAK